MPARQNGAALRHKLAHIMGLKLRLMKLCMNAAV
jgi:hypothetical protein